MKTEEYRDKQTDATEKEYRILKSRIRDDYVYLYLDHDEELMISIDAYFSFRIKDRKCLDEEAFLKLKEDEKILKAYRSCLRKLAIKDHSIAQIEDFLRKKELDKSVIDKIIGRLLAYGFLDDEKYTLSRISLLHHSKVSFKAIRKRLQNEGIADELIKRHLHYDEEEETKKVSFLAEKYLGSIHNRSVRASKDKVISKLIADGFSYDTILSVTDDLKIESSKEEELLTKEYEKALNKYAKKYTDYDLSRRIYGALLQKGFRSEDIRKVMDKQDG